MCRVLEVSASGYYAWLKRPDSEREMANQKLLLKIKEIHQQSDKRYGVPRVYKALRGQGYSYNRKRIERLMRLNDIRAKQKKRFKLTTQSDHQHPVAPNLLAREFTAERPNEKWVSDITYIPTGEGWLYLAGVMDLHSRKIVGWAMDKRMTSDLVCDAFKMAVAHRQPGFGLLHHSDRGSQYAAKPYQDLLKEYQCQISMSRKGNCWDNAPMESFFATLKNELVHHQAYQTRTQAKSDIFAYIEAFYNRIRLHSTLDYQSPVQFELAYFRLN
jgi:transposase InsO family protein